MTKKSETEECAKRFGINIALNILGLLKPSALLVASSSTKACLRDAAPLSMSLA